MAKVELTELRKLKEKLVLFSSVNFTFAIVVLPPHHNFSIAHNRRKHNAVVVDHKYMGASAPNS